MKESIPVTIFGQTFLLRSTTSAEEVQRVADFVNRSIEDVASKNRVADSLHLALLAFLNVAEQYLRLQDTYTGSHQEINARLQQLTERIELVIEEDSGSL